MHSRQARVNVKAAAEPEDEDADRSATMKPTSILDWYRILRVHHQWTIFRSIQFALWLAR